MNIKKKINWSIAFVLLGVFTISAVRGSLGFSESYNLAFAQVLEDSGNQRLVVVENGGRLENRPFRERFSWLDLVCAVNEEQYKILKKEFDAELIKVTIEGEEVDLVKIKEKAREHLKKLLDKWNGSDPLNCKVVKR